MKLKELLTDVECIAYAAGDAIMAMYQNDKVATAFKHDDTPVTEADLAANEVITSALLALDLGYPILSEESEHLSFQQRRHWSRYWLIDPLDGTGEFIQRSGDFAVNIALVENGRPILGVIYAPVSGKLYAATHGGGAWRKDSKTEEPVRIHAQKLAGQQCIRFAVSRRQKIEVLTNCLPPGLNAEFIPYGSATLKNCMVAEGSADCYVRFGPTGEWDTGASEVILEEAGGGIRTMKGELLSYNARETLINKDFMTIGDLDYPWLQTLGRQPA